MAVFLAVWHLPWRDISLKPSSVIGLFFFFTKPCAHVYLACEAECQVCSLSGCTAAGSHLDYGEGQAGGQVC